MRIINVSNDIKSQRDNAQRVAETILSGVTEESESVQKEETKATEEKETSTASKKVRGNKNRVSTEA